VQDEAGPSWNGDLRRKENEKEDALHLELPGFDAEDFDVRVSAMRRQNLGSVLFMVAAGISFLFSVGLWFSGWREEGLFVGIWVPSILAFGSLLLSGREGGR
jgi:hypothetical protein